MKLIVGSQFRFPEHDRVVLLAPTQEAYSQLCELVTRARRKSEKGSYSTARQDLEADLDACIALWLPAPTLYEAHAEWFYSLPFVAKTFRFAHTLEQSRRSLLEELRVLSKRWQLPIAATD